jgi:hypothetical protein
LLRVIPKILIDFQTHSNKCSFWKHLQLYIGLRTITRSWHINTQSGQYILIFEDKTASLVMILI